MFGQNVAEILICDKLSYCNVHGLASLKQNELSGRWNKGTAVTGILALMVFFRDLLGTPKMLGLQDVVEMAGRTSHLRPRPHIPFHSPKRPSQDQGGGIFFLGPKVLGGCRFDRD